MVTQRKCVRVHVHTTVHTCTPVHTHFCTCMCTYAHTLMHTYPYACMHTHAQVPSSVSTCTCTLISPTPAHSCIHMCAQLPHAHTFMYNPCTHVCILTNMHACTCVHIHLCKICTHTHTTHTCTLMHAYACTQPPMHAHLRTCTHICTQPLHACTLVHMGNTPRKNTSMATPIPR